MLLWTRGILRIVSKLSHGNLARFSLFSFRGRATRHDYQAYSQQTPSLLYLPYTCCVQAFPKLHVTSDHQRTLFLDSLPTILIPPVAFFGLLVTLWTYKCLMMVLFQDKIIYMPYIPPFSRSEKMDDYVGRCRPVNWESRHIKSLDGTKIALCIGQIPQKEVQDTTSIRQVIICYFQGNGSSLPPRLPMLSNVLGNIQAAHKYPSIQYVLIALSYRGYWTSSGRASQRGIELDAQAFLDWVGEEFAFENNIRIILWGQSIGAGVASVATATYLLRNDDDRNLHIQGLVLETPFSNIRSMLSAMYPQKWLPYGYLWPFLWNHWDSESALRSTAQHVDKPSVLLLPATKDEIVPSGEADKLEQLCRDIGIQVQRRDVPGALHTEATLRKSGQDAVTKFILDLSQSS